MKDETYSPLKALRHLDIVEAVRYGKPARPAHVQIILSDLCDMACNFCAYRDPSYSSSQLFRSYEPDSKKGLRKTGAEEYNFNPNRTIHYAKVLEILDDCAAMGVSGIQFTGGGEPTVHPRFLDVITQARALNLPFSLVTNGAGIPRKGLADALSYAAWVRISIDAGDAKTYAAIRHVPEKLFTETFDAIRELRAARERNGTGLVIGVGFVVTPENWQGIEQAALLAKEAGADNIRISAQFSAQEETLFAPFYAQATELCEKAKALATEGFEVVARFGEKLADLKQKSPEYSTCGYQHFTTYIGADLNLYRCCVYAYNERGKYGSIANASFKDVWLSQERADAMSKFDAKGCERCQFNTINKNLEYVLQPDDPKHSEFV